MTNEQIVAEISRPIDLLDLETTLSRHAYLFQMATDELPELKQDVHRRKVALDRIYSEEFLKVKEQGLKDKAKITDKATEAMVQTSKRYREAQDAWLNAKRALDDVERVAVMFQHRESAIKRLVDLYQSQYWTLSGVQKFRPQAAAPAPNNAQAKPADGVWKE